MRDDPIERTFLDACGFHLHNCPTADMRADGLTKPYDTKAKWDYAVWMLGMRYSPDQAPVPPPPTGKPTKETDSASPALHRAMPTAAPTMVDPATGHAPTLVARNCLNPFSEV